MASSNVSSQRNARREAVEMSRQSGSALQVDRQPGGPRPLRSSEACCVRCNAPTDQLRLATLDVTSDLGALPRRVWPRSPMDDLPCAWSWRVDATCKTACRSRSPSIMSWSARRAEVLGGAVEAAQDRSPRQRPSRACGEQTGPSFGRAGAKTIARFVAEAAKPGDLQARCHKNDYRAVL